MTIHQQDIPSYILESKKRCEMRGMDSNKIPNTHYIPDDELQKKLIDYNKLISVFNTFAEKFIQTLNGMPLILIVTDDEGTILKFNGDSTMTQSVQQLGIKPGALFTEETNGTNSASLALRLNEPVEVIGMQHYHSFLQQTACYTVPFEVEDKVPIRGTISIMTFVDYQSPLLLTMLTTVVGSIEREFILKEKNNQLNILNQIVTDNAKTAIIQTDEHGEVTKINSFGEKLTGWHKETIIGKKIEQLSPLAENINQILTSQQRFNDIELRFTCETTGYQTVCLLDGRPLYDEKGRLTGAFAQLKDMTDRYEAEERINYLAYHDDLTGLPNRRYFHKVLKEKMENAKVHTKKFSIFLLDLDRFKMINDTLGHEKGDWLLVQVSKRLLEYLPNNAELFRMGGDEFTVILNGLSNVSETTSIAEGIIQLFQQPFAIANYEFHISTSIGIATYLCSEYDADTLFRKADTAMYRAKEQGKNSYFVYESTLENYLFEKLTFEQELRHAIQNNQLELYYQPQISLFTQKIVGVEALIRWNHPTFGLIYPGDIIPLAEELGLADTLGEWVLQRACHQSKEWQNRDFLPIKVAVNLSPQDFLQHALVDRVKQVLIETNLEPQYLEIEITESMTMDVDHAIATMENLHELGVQIAIDDFGKGYSSLNYLKNFPIDHLKIDRSFVNDILNDHNDVKIISAIISLAHGLNLKVIAEGVETKEQASFLSNLLCDQAQGYYYSKPLPVSEIEKLL
ncbi:EAL domain-containing protein [Ureibacillus sp. NPDC094379]